MLHRILLLSCILLGLQISVFAQIFEPEGLNMPGAWNSWTNSPTNNLYLASSTQVTNGKVTRIATGVARYQTVFLAGTNVPAGTHGFLFTSGPTTNYWNNKWAGVNVIMDSLQNYSFNTGADNSITLTSGKYYTMNWRDAGYTGTNAVFMLTSAEPVSISTVTQSPAAGSVFSGQSVTVTVTTAGLKSAEEKVYVRYSTDDFATSSLVLVSFTDSVGTAAIPALTGSVKYYAFSTTKSSITANHDMYTLKLNNNSGTNYSYTVQNNFISTQSGDWNTASTWTAGSVPPAGAQISVNHPVTVNFPVTSLINKININSGGSLTFADTATVTVTDTVNINGGTLDMTAGGTITLNNAGIFRFTSGTFTQGAGTIAFAGVGSVVGQVAFNNVRISGGVNFGAYSGSNGSTIHGTLTINAGGFILTNIPYYATGSTLKYNSGNAYNRSIEWSDTTTGAVGYPFNVQISNNSTLLVSGSSGAATFRRMAGSLTIDAGSTFSMSTNNMTAAVRVLGNITNNGTLILSGAVGGDLQVYGNFTNNGTFTHNSRSIDFIGSSVQTISASAPLTMAYVGIDNSAGVSLSQAVTILNVITMSNGRVFLNNNNLTLDSTATFSGTPSSSKMIVVNGTGVLRKKISANGSFTFPVGDTTSTADYSPATLNFTAGTYSSGYVSVGVTNAKYSGVSENSVFLNRYWTVSSTGITGFTCNTFFKYNNSDVTGTEDSLYLFRYDTVWTRFSKTSVSADSLSGTVTSFGTFTAYQPTWAASVLNLSLTAFLQGSYVQVSNQQIADTVKVYLKNIASLAVLDSATGVLSASGTVSLTFNNINTGTYYININHRNSIDTYSKSGGEVLTKGASNSYDFTTSQANTYGNNVILIGSKYCIYSGDVNKDGIVDLSDLLSIDNDNANFATGYLLSDLNGDQVTDLSDLLVCDNNNASFVSAQVPPMAKKKITQRIIKLD